MNEKKMNNFNEWLESIRFVDKNGKVLPTKLYPDTTPDPEGDRGGD